MKYITALFLALGLIGCAPDTPAEKEQQRIQRLKEAEYRIEQVKLQASACDKNGGIKDIPPVSCGRGGCMELVIKCNDGMQRNFEYKR